MYNDNKYFLIHEIVFSLYKTMYNNNIYLSLYKKMYNENKHFLIHESVYHVIRDDI